MRYAWISLGWLCVGLGVAGAFLPLLPTTPFLLLAAYSFSRGSERMHQWLIHHPTWGPPIRDWQEYRAISRATKVYASVAMVLVFILSLLFRAPWWALTAQASILIFVAAFLWTRKERDTVVTNSESDAASN